MKVKLLLLSLFSLLVSLAHAQLIQGTIKKGANDDQFEIWLRPDFSNSTQYLFQIQMPIAFPASASPQPTGINVVLDPGFTAAFGSNYPVQVYPKASSTTGTESYFVISMVRGGAGASNPQTWTAGTEFKVLTGTFTYAAGATTFQAKLADYQDGGGDGQGNFYTVSGNGDYYVTSNSIGNFYASPGNSIVGGTAAAGYAQLMAAVNSGTVSGTSPLCIGATATYTTDGTAGGTWSSTNTGVATVNASTGLVTAVSAGTTDITYTISGVSSFKTLTVNPNVSAGTVSGSSPLCIGGTFTFTSNGTAGGTWSSSNTAVATVDANSGLVTAVGAGTADITYTVSSGCGSPVSAFASLTVNPNVSAGTVSGTSPLTVGGTATYTSNGTAGGTWSSSNTSVATVDANSGLVTAVGAGSADIIYTVNSGCGSPVSAQQTLTVNAPTNAGVVSGTSPLCIGATATYTSDGDAGGTWSSTNTSVATVDANSGLVTAVAAGTADITYTVNGVSAFKTLTVSPNVNAGTVSGTSPLCIGGTATFSSTGDAGGTWSSSNTSVATVDANSGLVTAVGAGTADITYTVSSGCGSPVSAFASLTVNPNVSAGTVSGTSPLTVGGTATYTSNGTAGGTWSSSNTSVATVDANSGLVTAVAAGTANIIYTVNSGCGSPVSAQQSLTVNAPTNAGVVSGASPLCIGGTATYTSDGDAGGTWSSTNTGVATVDANSGLVTAVAAGTADITYTVNGVSAFKTLTVSPNVNAGTVSGTSPLTVGQTATFSSTGDAGGTWSSSNTSVATVNASSGLVTAVGAGSANIIYTINSGCGSPVSASASLTVNAAEVQLIQGTIKPGANAGEIEVWLKPSFNNSTEYLFQIGMPIAFPASAPTTPTSLNVTLDPAFVAAFGSNYSMTVNPVATATGGTEQYFNIVLIRGGDGASDPQTWTSGTEFKVLTATFVPAGSPGTQVKLADYQDGGSDGQGNFYTVSGNGNYYVTANSIGNFYEAPGLSTVGGDASAGFAQTIATIGCVAGNAGTVSGTSPLTVGQTATYTSNGDAGGTWSSSNTAVATVDANSGLVTAVAAGTADITYTVSSGCSPVSASASLTVNAPSNAGVVSGASPLCIGGTATYTSDGDAGGTWSSTNTSVATVDANSGLVTAVAAGTTDITYTVNGVSAFKTLTVSPNVNAGTVSGTSPLTVGQTATFSSTGDAGGTWSSSNTSVATVDANSGLVTAVGAGSTNIIYTINSGCGSPVSASASLTVNAAEVQLIQGTIKPGANAGEVEVWLKPSFNNNTEYLFQIGMPIAFPASAPTAPTSLNVTLDPAFVAAFGSNYSVTVNPVANATGGTEQYFNIVLIRGGDGASDPQTWTSGTEFKVLTATFVPAGSPGTQVKLADYQDGGSDGQGNFYTVSGNGNYYVTANSVGNFYEAPGLSVVGGDASAGYAQTIATIGCVAGNAGTVSGTSPLTVGQTATYTSNGDAGGTWSSSNTSVATVDANSGLVTAVGAGSADITYTVSSGCSPVSASASLTVIAPSNAGVVSGASPLCIGATATYTSDGDAGGTWSSTNTSVATVDPNTGLVTAVAAGTTDITYTVGDASAFKTLTVDPNVNAGTVSGTSPLTVGGTATFSSTGTSGGTWSSSNTSVATVDANSGLVTAVAVGSTNIIYTVSSGCGSPVSASASLTVEAPAGSQLIQGTIKPGAAPGQVEVWLKPDFDNNTQYLFQIGMPIAVPASGTVVEPTGLNVTLDPAFVAAFGNNYSVTVNPVATNTAGTERYFNIVLIRGGDGASEPQTWTSGTEFRVLTATFVPGGSPGTQVKLADYQDGGSDGQGNFYTVSGNGNYYVTSNSIGNFYAAPGESIVGGDAQAGYAQTIATIGGCDNPVVEAITGNLDVCVGATTQLSSATPDGVWSSSDNGVATVDANGLVTGVSAGTATISYAVANSCGTTTVTATVTVSALPVLTTQNLSGGGCSGGSVDLNTGITSSTAGLTVEFFSDAGMTNSIPAIVNNPGTYYVRVTNGAGCSATGSIVVSGSDAQNPVVNCPGNVNTTTSSCSKSIAIAKPTYSDNCSVVSLTWELSGATTGNSPATGINFVGTKTFNVGVTTITYTATDGAGNSASCSFTVKVTESKAPVVKCPASITKNASSESCGADVAVGNPAVSDNCGVAVVSWVMTGATEDNSPTTGINYVGTHHFNVGTTTVKYTVKDASGNSASCSFTVKVVDKQAPMLDCPNDITEVVTTGCSKSITVPDPVYSDNCGISTVAWAMIGATNAISPLTGINTVGTRTFNIGVTYVTYAVKDVSGNIRICTFKVTVEDNTDPVVSCPGNINQSVSGNKCYKSVSVPNPTFSDNCKVSKLTWVMSGATKGSSSSFGINYVGTKTFNVGVTTVKYTATDLFGNSATCSFTVTITNPKCSGNPGKPHGKDKDDLRLIVNPNPSSHFFMLRILSSSNEEVEVNVYDGHGRRVDRMRGSAQQTYKFGYLLKSGVYMVEVLQGGNREVTRIVKL